MQLLEFLFLPMIVVHDYPPLALIPAALFAAVAIRRRRHGERIALTGAAAAAWAVYTLYELQLGAWEKTVIAPIRLDLLLIAPVLYALTIAAAIQLYRAWHRRSGPGA